jgi:Peptidase M50B-like
MTGMHAPSPGQLWHEAVSAQPLPSRPVILLCCLAALILVGSRQLWPVTRTAVTMAHEGGHALVALVVGRRLEGVRLHRSTAGLTVSAGNSSGPGIVATAAAGYLAPPVLGLGAAALLASGHLVATLLLSLALLAGLLLMTRNAYGVLAVLTVAAVVAVVLWRGIPLAQAVFGYAMTWFLLIGGVRPVLELQRSRRRGRAGRSDADQLARLTGVPAGVWVVLFALVAIGALAVSAFWLMY